MAYYHLDSGKWIEEEVDLYRLLIHPAWAKKTTTENKIDIQIEASQALIEIKRDNTYFQELKKQLEDGHFKKARSMDFDEYMEA